MFQMCSEFFYNQVEDPMGFVNIQNFVTIIDIWKKTYIQLGPAWFYTNDFS